jgi:mutator protein MutT
MQLRKQNTNEQIRCIEVVAAIIKIGSNAVLIAKKPAKLAKTAFWEFPGGKVEAQETHAQALRREIDEELGVEIKVGSLFQSIVINQGNDELRISFYFAQIKRGVPEPKTHSALQIISLDELATSVRKYRFHKADKKVVTQLLQG